MARGSTAAETGPDTRVAGSPASADLFPFWRRVAAGRASGTTWGQYRWLATDNRTGYLGTKRETVQALSCKPTEKHDVQGQSPTSPGPTDPPGRGQIYGPGPPSVGLESWESRDWGTIRSDPIRRGVSTGMGEGIWGVLRDGGIPGVSRFTARRAASPHERPRCTRPRSRGRHPTSQQPGPLAERFVGGPPR